MKNKTSGNKRYRAVVYYDIPEDRGVGLNAPSDDEAVKRVCAIKGAHEVVLLCGNRVVGHFGPSEMTNKLPVRKGPTTRDGNGNAPGRRHMMVMKMPSPKPVG